MSTTSPVLVGLKTAQPAVLAWALELAARDGRPLRVVHTWALDAPYPEYSHGGLTADRLKAVGWETLDAARRQVEESGTQVKTSYELIHGSAADVLRAESKDSAVVVIGTDAVSWWSRLLGDDVSHHVALHSSCSVVVVPERSLEEPLTGGVMVAMEGDRPADGPLAFAFEEADRRGCGLQVIYAERHDGDHREAARRTLATMVDRWRRQYPYVPVETVHEAGDPARLAAALTPLSQLFVVGRSPAAGSWVTLRRPAAAQAVRDARCPVAVVPRADLTA